MGQPQDKNQYTEADFRQEIIDAVPALEGAFLRAVHAMLMKYGEVEQDKELLGYEPDGTPISKQDFLAEADDIVDRMEAGEERPANDVYKSIEKWLKPTE